MAGKRKTIDRLISAAQGILSESGIEALNSNAIVERAGLTPPTFYHYFPNKHALLRELGILMMQAQSEVIRADTGLSVSDEADLRKFTGHTLREALRMTREFEGGYALLISLRALPELRDVRNDYQEEMADLLVAYFDDQGLCTDAADMKVRAQLSLSMAYAAIEMMFETEFSNEEQIMDLTADAIVRIYDMF